MSETAMALIFVGVLLGTGFAAGAIVGIFVTVADLERRGWGPRPALRAPDLTDDPPEPGVYLDSAGEWQQRR